jgi:prephenate dehydrogenase
LRVVGTGLLGASVGLGLRAQGIDVIVADASPTNLQLAVDYGAGRRPADTDDPGTHRRGRATGSHGRGRGAGTPAFPDALVTDVASVKVAPLAELSMVGADLTPLHRLASHGRSRTGRCHLRSGRSLHRASMGHRGARRHQAAQIAIIEHLALDLGAVPVSMSAEDHDRSRRARLPRSRRRFRPSSRVASSMAEERSLSLAGQGLRDTTRIASSAPELWVQIMGANSKFIIEVLRDLRHRPRRAPPFAR